MPPLTTLAVFEAAARNLNFSRAADELNVTVGAVSRQVKALEDGLGVKLFVREKNGVQLTPSAQDLFAEVAASFSRCSSAIQAVKLDQRRAKVTFACTDGFATFWLMPRMQDFWSRYPHISVNHLISEHVRDMRNAEVDLFVRPASGVWPNERTEMLFDDLIYPVCGTEFAKRHRDVTPSDLPDLPLLDMDWVNLDWPRWLEFLQAQAVPHQGLRGQRFGQLSVMLSAAEANQGVGLGWDSLVRPLIEKGRLARITNLSMPDPVGFCLAWNERKPLSPAAVILKEWILEQAKPIKA